MNKTAIKNFAIWARVQLIEAVKQKAFEYEVGEDNNVIDLQVIGGRLLSDTEREQRNELIRQVKRLGFHQVMEQAAYTWFNRFIALRYMEVKTYLPSKIRIFSDENNAFKPQVLKEAMTVEIDGLDRAYVLDLLDKQDNETLYKYLIITQCNALNALLPEMFEKISNWTELLFPNNLLSAGSLLDRLVTDIDATDWEEQVQIIGWLYQFYNSELKDETYAELKKKIKLTKERIPAVTQLFTPDWIVRYMVENSLGRLWVEGHPDEAMKSEWKYYLEEAEQEADVQAQLDTIRAEYANIKPEEIKIIDPSMGSGHVLVYAFDVLMQIYRSQGWSERDAAKSIVEKNLYGIDIDERAYQLAYFAVMMKARSYSRRILTQDVKCNLCAIHESNELNYEYLSLFGDLKASAIAVADEMKDAKEYGSILIIKTPLEDLLKLQAAVEVIEKTAYDNFFDSVKQSGIITDFKPLLKQAIALAQKYDVVVTNPPYMAPTEAQKPYLLKNFKNSKNDLATTFIERNLELCDSNGLSAIIVFPTWMFLESYEALRKDLVYKADLINMVYPGRGIFGSDFGSCTFVLKKNRVKKYRGRYYKLFDKIGEVESNHKREQQFLCKKGEHIISQESFSIIPSSPIAFWVSKEILKTFENSSIGKVCEAKAGIVSGNDEYFLKLWYEISIKKITFSASDFLDKQRYIWVPINKGGSYRRFYGNYEYIINIYDLWNSTEKVNISVRRSEPEYYFKKSIIWSATTLGASSFRYSENKTSSTAAPSLYFDNEDDLFVSLSLLNSCLSQKYMDLLNPTIGLKLQNVISMPLLNTNNKKSVIVNTCKKCIALTRLDWDSFETSWDFKKHPLIYRRVYMARLIADKFKQWEEECNERFNQLKANEEELNRIFIEIYGLQDELTPEVEDKDVTVRKADLQRDIKSLISYAVGCMFGRYVPDAEGLQYAGGSWSEFLATCNSQLATEMIDSNNIIPITDDEYFDDDIVGYFVNFVRKVYGEETLEENLKFIADALGGSGTPREVIRKYFLTGFYKDHLKIYQKRPIYWLFDSGKKNGFKALIYMHRYTPDLLARMRTDYIHEQQERYRTQIALTEEQLLTAAASEKVKLNKKLAKLKDQALEVQVYEEKIHHLADMMIDIDLDDGVKVNYAKFGDLLAKI